MQTSAMNGEGFRSWLRSVPECVDIYKEFEELCDEVFGYEPGVNLLTAPTPMREFACVRRLAFELMMDRAQGWFSRCPPEVDAATASGFEMCGMPEIATEIRRLRLFPGREGILTLENMKDETLFDMIHSDDIEEAISRRLIEMRRGMAITGREQYIADAVINGSTKTLTKLLGVAASRGDTETLKLLIERKVDINVEAGILGQTPLKLAVEGGHSECVRMLIDAGADVCRQDHCDNSPLTSASVVGSTDIAAMLIAAGADVNARDIHGATALHYAVQRKNSALVQLLIDKGANVNSTDRHHNSPLHRAASEGNLEAARMLLARGADVTLKMDEGLTALQEAIAWHHDDISALLRTASSDTQTDSVKSLDRSESVTLDTKSCKTCGALLDPNRCKTVFIPCKCGEIVEVDISTILPRGADVIHQTFESFDALATDFSGLLQAAKAINDYISKPKYCRYRTHVPATAICPSCRGGLVRDWQSLISVSDVGEDFARNSSEPLWWAYLHKYGSVEVKDWYAGNSYISEAQESPMVSKYLREPFKARDHDEATIIARRLLGIEE